MSASTTPSPCEQRAVVDQVLSTMAGIHLLPERPVDVEAFMRRMPLTSMLRYSSPVDQTIILQCSPELALVLTSSFFDRSLPTSTSDGDVTDTMMELVNMIGGNLKALMPENTSVSIPSAISSEDFLKLVDRHLSQLWLVTSSGLMCLTFVRDACSRVDA